MASLARQVTQGISWLALATAGQRIASLLVAAILARLLPAGDFGLISMALLSVNLIAICRDIGITTSLVQRSEVTDVHLSTGFWLNFGAGVVLYAVGIVLSPLVGRALNQPRVVELIPYLLLSVPIYTVSQVPDAILQRRMDFRTIALTEVGSTVAAGIIGVAMAMTGYGVWSLVAQNLAFAACLALTRLVAARWLPRSGYDHGHARELLRFSGSVFGGSLAAYAMRNVDNAIVGATQGVSALGYYALAYNLMLMPGYVVTNVVTRVLFPALASIRADVGRMRVGYLRAVRLASSLTIPVAVGMGVTAPLLIAVVYGDKWALSGTILQILAVVGLLEGMNFWGVVYYAIGKPQLLLLWFAGCFVVMGVIFAYASRWGVLGIATAYALLAPFTLGTPHFIIARMIGLSPALIANALVPPLASALVMGACIAFLRLSPTVHDLPAIRQLAVLVVTGVILYGLSMTTFALAQGTRHGMLGWWQGRHILENEG